MSERVIVYIDGFNLYYGLRESRYHRFYWLDIQRVALNMLYQNQQLEIVRYFTAKIHHNSNDPDKTKRQANYLKDLESLPNVCIHYGYYHIDRGKKCRCCNTVLKTHKEKMTDINIAVKLLEDAQNDMFDTALLVSGDSDLSGAIESIHSRYDKKQVIAYFPPARRSKKNRKGGCTCSFCQPHHSQE